MSDEDRKIPMPQTDVVTTRPVDGWLARGEVDPDHPPPAVAPLILIPRRDDADVVAAIRERMIARHAAAFGIGDE